MYIDTFNFSSISKGCSTGVIIIVATVLFQLDQKLSSPHGFNLDLVLQISFNLGQFYISVMWTGKRVLFLPYICNT